MDRSLIEASADLYAPPLATFRQVTLPLIFPGILAGFLLSFTFSFDDFIIAFFVAGSETTLPIYVFSSIRRGRNARDQCHRHHGAGGVASAAGDRAGHPAAWSPRQGRGDAA